MKAKDITKLPEPEFPPSEVKELAMKVGSELVLEAAGPFQLYHYRLKGRLNMISGDPNKIALFILGFIEGKESSK